jgi:hypothetical protein
MHKKIVVHSDCKNHVTVKLGSSGWFQIRIWVTEESPILIKLGGKNRKSTLQTLCLCMHACVRVEDEM